MENFKENQCKLEVRIIRLVPMKVISSTHEGCSPIDERMLEFVSWAKSNGIKFNPGMRTSFMFENKKKKGYELIAAIPDDLIETGIYDVKIFEGGLFAVTSAYVEEIFDKYNLLINWINESEHFELDTFNGEFKQEPMGEMITPEDISQKFQIEQQDIYVPIRLKR